jgi:catechol 2,3-dioxygenase-like lactoylglutathione lyase family enzyme
MNIVGLDALVFGVDDMPTCTKFLLDYGLQSTGHGRFEALDGTAVVLRAAADPTLPPPLSTASKLRETVYGVADAATLDAIRKELMRDREVRVAPDGSLSTHDDMGFALRFQRTTRKALPSAGAEFVNTPGVAAQRAPNVLGLDLRIEPRPRTLSHVVYFVPDAERAEAFYVQRLGFACTDRFVGVGPFLRPAGTLDHHTLFFIQTPPFLQGVEHFTFHMAGPTEVMLAGTRFLERGHKSFWGPGRHVFGSNWFWYFDSPLGCRIEYDADMDLHDDSWQPRAAPMSADASQGFLFTHRERWIPGAQPPDRKP